MNSVQKTGLLTLGLLLVVALVGFLLGPNKAQVEDGEPDVAVVDIGALQGVQFVPPERREFWIRSEDFRQPPVKHPIEGGDGVGIDQWGELPDATPSSAEARPASYTGPAMDLGAPPVTYRVRESDNLQKIARKTLGDSGRWREIAQLNGMTEPFVVKIGDLLKLPVGAPRPEYQQETTSETPETAATPEAKAGWTTHVVQANETPSDISMAVYGTSRLWKLILEANGIDDPRKVRKGQTLQIPPRP